MTKDLHTFEAVTFEFQPQQFRTIGSLEQLSGYLEQVVSGETGQRFLVAQRACAEAMAGIITASQARERFVEALGEIGITPQSSIHLQAKS